MPGPRIWIAGLLLLAPAVGGCHMFERTETACTVCDCLEYKQGYREAAGVKIKTSTCANLRCEHPRSSHGIALLPETHQASEDGEQTAAAGAADTGG